MSRSRRPRGAGRSPEASRSGSSSAGRQRVGTGVMIPIALKFAAFIAVLVVASMLWQATTAVRIATEHIDRLRENLDSEITRDGVSRVNSLANLIEPHWLSGQDRDDLAAIDRLLQRYAGGAQSDVRLHDIVVFSEAAGGILTNARGTAGSGGQLRSEGATIRDDVADRTGVTVRECEVEGVPVRSFSKPVIANTSTEKISQGTRAGRVEVLLFAREIEQSRDELSRSMRNVTVIACLGATLAAFLLASFLTRPIRILVRDMRQVSLGDLRHQSSVNSSDELGRLALTFNAMTGNLQTAEAAKITQKALEHELSLATSIQSGLLPDEIPTVDGVGISAFYLSAKEVGGDYYDFIPIDDDHLGVVIADVSGKGVPGSLVMTMTRSLLHMAARDETSPATTLREVNRCLSVDMSSGMFVTLVYLVLQKSTREVRLIRAGHNAPLLYCARADRLLHLQKKGIAIGLDRSGPLFDSNLEVQRFTLQCGDVLVLYTDGIVEGKDRQGRDFGDERLEDLIRRHHGLSHTEIVEIIVNDLSQHQRGIERSDDITVVVLKAD